MRLFFQTIKMAKQERKFPLEKTSLSELWDFFDENSLFIIGNGFDLAHGLQTAYKDFEKRIRANPLLRETLKQYVDVDCWWKDLEESLAKIKYKDIINPKDILNGIYNEGKFDIDDPESFDRDIEELIKPIKLLTRELTVCFKNWIDRLSTNISNYKFLGVLSKKSLYFSFNYTDILECNYLIPDNNVCHIHGERRKPERGIIIGHSLEEDGQDYDEKDFKNMDEDTQEIVWYVIEKAYEHLEKYVGLIEKNCQKIINRHLDFFEKINKVNKITIIGHSLGRVDYPYFKKIISSCENRKTMKWYISFYSDDDIKSIKEFINYFKLDINNVYCFSLQKNKRD